MQNGKYLIPLLALVFLIPAGINAQTTPGENETEYITGPIGTTDETLESTDRDMIHELSAYEQVMIKNNVGMTDASSDTINEYVEMLRKYRDNLEPYQNTVMTVFDELAQLELDIEEAKSTNQTDTTIAQETQYEELINKLEGWGITTQDNIETDPSYWMRKAISFKASHDATTVNTSGNGDHFNTHQIHAGNSALKINSIIWYPCASLASIQVSCFVLDWGWNIDTTVVSVSPLPTSGKLSFGVDVCNERDIDHVRISFDYEIDRSITSSIGTSLYDWNTDTTASLNGERTFFNCLSSTKYLSVPAGSSAEQTMKITDISVSSESHST